MSEKVKLIFECVAICNPEYADDLGKDIASDLLMSMDNGVDYLDWRYVGSGDVINKLENEIATYKEANKTLKKTVDMLRK